MKKKWIKTLRWVVLIYLLIGVALHYFQEKFLFHPEKLDSTYQFNFTQPFREVNLAVNAEKTISIVQFTVPDSIRKGVVLYFHGNKEHIGRYAKFSTVFTRNNYEVWMIDYPGFGKTTGERSETTMYEDAKIFYKLATSTFNKESIIIYGKSIGTGVASFLASVRDCKQLILESPFTSMHDLMRNYTLIYPVSYISKYHFPTEKYLEHIKVPVTIVHGTKDETIPFKFSKRLKAKFPSITLVPVKKGKHNGLTEFPEYNETLDAALK